jgi:hypothetical protein
LLVPCQTWYWLNEGHTQQAHLSWSQQVDKLVDLLVELRVLLSDNRDFHKWETEFQRQNQKLKVQMEQEKQEHIHDTAKFKASIMALGTQLEEYCTQMDIDGTGMGEKFAQELANAKESRYKIMGACFNIF